MIDIYPHDLIQRGGCEIPGKVKSDIHSAVLRVFETHPDLRDELLRGEMGRHAELLELLEDDPTYLQHLSAGLSRSRARFGVCLALQKIQIKLEAQQSF